MDVALGMADFSKAATPTTIGVAMDVPLIPDKLLSRYVLKIP